jgi:hypothetical protein
MTNEEAFTATGNLTQPFRVNAPDAPASATGDNALPDPREAERRSRYVAACDPRRLPRVTDRDLDALLFIGRGYEVAQYQVHEAIFTGLAEGVMSRWTQRMLKRGFVAVERWAKVGINRLRLTRAGRDTLVAHRMSVDDVFIPKTPTALKDVQHTLWINDLRVVMPRLKFAPDTVAPAWLLQRRFAGTRHAVPDLLAIRSPRPGDMGFLLAVEIDLGGERLKAVFLPKLKTLFSVASEWSGGAPAAVVVLTRGERRAAAIRLGLEGESAPVLVSLLPSVPGRAGLRELAQQLDVPGKR